MADYKEVRHEHLYLRAPGTERLRKTSVELLARHCQLMLESLAPPAAN